jgi:hypothetical protein
MGEKMWVQNLNAWIGNFAVSFFKLGGARRAYLRSLNVTDMQMKELLKTLDKDIRKDEKISE